jgi:hypothetical protein
VLAVEPGRIGLGAGVVGAQMVNQLVPVLQETSQVFRG